MASGEKPTWRLKVPEGETVLDDMIRGKIVVRHSDVEDIILVRADGTPIYNLAVVIDDHLMAITHVLRGEDHLTNCFKQIILFRAFGWQVPRYGHLPLILAPAGEGKLSKRKHPEAAMDLYIAQDYHVEAFINWLALIGWSYDDKTTIMSRAELVERFKVEKISAGGARLNLEKLAAMSGEYIRKMSVEELVPHLQRHLMKAGFVRATPSAEESSKILALAKAEHPRLTAFSEIVDKARWAFADPVTFDEGAKKNLIKAAGTADLLRAYAATLPDPFVVPAELEKLARSFAEGRGLGFGAFVHPVRAALTGRTVGPGLFDCMAILGRARSVERLHRAASEAS